MSMNVLILGAKGILGRDLSYGFRDVHPLLWDITDLDITNQKIVTSRIKEARPEIIINAAAYTDVDKAESEPREAERINGHALKNLAQAASRTGAFLVHYSTDYVFDGKNRKGYTEEEESNQSINQYGASKKMGERFLIEEGKRNGLRYFLIRTSWLFGPLWRQKKHENNFVDTILKLSETRDEIRVVNDQFGRPMFSKDLARETRVLLMGLSPGVYHVTNSTGGRGVSWYQFAKKIIELSGKSTRVVPCTTHEFPRPAARPKYSVLRNTKLQPLRPWEEALAEYLEVKKNPRAYFARFKNEGVDTDTPG